MTYIMVPKSIDTHIGFSRYKDTYYDNKNKKVVGNFKDEHDGKIFAEHIGLKHKMQCCVNDDGQALKKGIGIPRTIIKQELPVKRLHRNIKR